MFAGNRFPPPLPLVVFDLAAQLVRVGFGPDDQPLQVLFRFDPDPLVEIKTVNGHTCTIQAFPPPEPRA